MNAFSFNWIAGAIESKLDGTVVEPFFSSELGLNCDLSIVLASVSKQLVVLSTDGFYHIGGNFLDNFARQVANLLAKHVVDANCISVILAYLSYYHMIITRRNTEAKIPGL